MSLTSTCDESLYGHILSFKSVDLDRDTFVFVTLSQKSKLYLGVNQKFTPVTSTTIHRWVKLMINSESFREFFLCPVTVESAGIMLYYVRPSGPAIEPESTEPLPPGNYGWYHDRECLSRGFPELSRVRQRLYTFQYRLESAAIEDPFPASTVARNDHRCRFTGSTTGAVLAWIIPPAVSWETDEWGDDSIWDKTPFIVDANVLPMHNSLVFYFHSNHFNVDVDDDYRILVLRAMGDAQLLPTHLPHQDAAVNHFLRLHCRYSLCLMLRGRNIEEVHPNWTIIDMMNQLRVNYTGGEDHEESEMAPLDDERWQTVLGQAILANVMQDRMSQSLYESGYSDSGSDTPDDNSQPVPPAPRRRWVDMNDPVNQQRYAAFLGADWSNQRSPLPIG